MAASFNPSESQVTVEVGVYQDFSNQKPEGAAAETTSEPKFGHFRVLLLSFGLLCVLQGILNITLRLRVTEPADEGEPEEESCPQAWLMFGSSCYYISSQRRTWNGSRQDCLQRDADLVIINSREEQAFLTGFTQGAWVGMTDREKEGTWIWVDGTLVKKARLQWAKGQPDGAFGGEDCGDLRTMIDFIGLNDAQCNVREQWICEKTLW